MSESDILHSQNIIRFEKSRGESLVLKQFLMARGRVSIHMLSRRQKVHPEREYLAALLSPPAHYLTIFHKKIPLGNDLGFFKGQGR